MAKAKTRLLTMTGLTLLALSIISLEGIPKWLGFSFSIIFLAMAVFTSFENNK